MSESKKKLNIVTIISDDQGYWALHCAGTPELKTPNIDKLHEKGIMFENFYCVSPVCSPARASIYSGTIPSFHGVQDWILSGNIDMEKYAEFNNLSQFTFEDKAIDYVEDQVFITDILKKEGYRCGMSGKWHLGDSIQPQHGFDDWYTIARGGCSYYKPEIVENNEIKIESEYVTDLITANAIKNIHKYKESDTPFFLSVNYTAPHYPWDRDNHPKEFMDLYEDCAFESVPNEPVNPRLSPDAPYDSSENGRHDSLQGYFASITAMDYGIGAIIQSLEDSGLIDDTIIIFTSDNGMNMGHHGIWGKGNGTFPQNLYETSIKVPFIISCPKVLLSNSINVSPHSHYDIFPTLLALLGVDHREVTNEDKRPGINFSDEIILNSPRPVMKPDQPIIIFSEYGPTRMIRYGDWKYVSRIPYGPDELYNLKVDTLEKYNVIDDERYVEIKVSLKNRLRKWFLSYANLEKDASNECNTGRGQLCKVGKGSNGKNVFLFEDSYKRYYDNILALKSSKEID